MADLDERVFDEDFKKNPVSVTPYRIWKCYKVLRVNMHDPASGPGAQVALILGDDYLKIREVFRAYGRCNVEGIIKSCDEMSSKYGRISCQGEIDLRIRENDAPFYFR